MNAYEFVLALVFLVVIVPIWLRLRYTRRMEAQAAVPPEDQSATSELKALAERLEDRVRTLERVLDAEAPGWRGRT